MARNFYYGKDARIVAGSAQFAALISASPSTYHISEQAAARYASLDAELQSTYRAAITPQTRTSVTVRLKDEALSKARREAAALAKVMYAKSAVDNAKLVELGLLPRAPRSPRTLPAEPPVLRVVSVVGRRVLLRIVAQSSESGRKPIAAVGAEIFAHVGAQAPSNPRQYRFEGLATRATTEIVFGDDVASGATVWVSAAWVSRRGARGRACAPVPVTIQGGPALAMAA